MKSTYKVDYGTGAGNFIIKTSSLARAKKAADADLSYSQTSTKIIDVDNNVIVARRTWYGCLPEKGFKRGCYVIGGGHYAPWEDCLEDV